MQSVGPISGLLKTTGLGICNLCGFPVLRIDSSGLGTRCLRCWSSQIHRAVGLIVAGLSAPDAAVYELSSRGALYRFLKKRFQRFSFSEYFDDVPPGQSRGGIVCQDVQRLLLADATFDLVTSTEVFEHVDDDQQGFREVRRVLKPGGHFVFSVPLENSARTVERCRRREDRSLEHLLAPQYHGDRIRGRSGVLVFRNYGRDIIERLAGCGFQSSIHTVASARHSIRDQPVIVARKDASA